MQHWNVNVQRQLGCSSVLEVAYVGSKGTKLLSARDINQPQPGVLPPNLPFVPRPNPFFDDVNLIESRASSTYHSLQARFQQRLSAGLALLGSYTWSKSIDDASNFFTSAGDPNFPQNSYDLRAERALSNFDVRHRLSVSYSYDLPFGRGRALLADRGFLTTLLTGWQTYGIVTAQTGRPFTVALIQEFDNSGTGRSSLGFGANDRPNVDGRPQQRAAHAGAVVQHLGLQLSRAGDVRQRRPQHPDRPRLPERQRVAREEHGARRGREPATARGVLQPLQPPEPEPARQLPGLAHVRARHLGARPAPHTVRREASLLEIHQVF